MFPVHDENPITITPYVNYTLIVLCVGIFLWQFSAGFDGQQQIIYHLGVIPAVLFGYAELQQAWVPAYATVFTSMFLHGGWMHLIGNMLYLWVFGNNIEAAMGHVRFIVFYLLCGVAAVMAQGLPDTDSAIPMVGASGAISGVLGAYLLLYPRARVTVVVPIIIILKTFRIPALVVLGLWFAMQLFSVLTTDSSEGGVAFGAHIGGFVAGVVLIYFFKYSHIPFGLFLRRKRSV